MDKWYIREDLFPEKFRDDRPILNCNLMLEIGNCFATKEIALEVSNKIKDLLASKSVFLINHT